ncbi:MAG: Fic/DOC family protein [Parachlamydiales bacterium]|nr:Fic/DOC family protein [Parachlamydiales bacterium]
MAVLHQLSLESDPICLNEILEKLGQGYVERSVRRWLAEMIQEGLVEKIGNKRGTKYRVLQRENRSIASCFGPESLKIIAVVRRPLYERVPVAYADHWFDAYHPNKDFYLSPAYRAQLFEAGKRSQNEEPAGTYAHQIFNRLLIDLSYNSSRLEGNTYSLLDTQKLLLEGAEAEGKLDEEKIMILNHKEAIRYLVDNASKLDVSTQTISTLHFLLSDGLVETRFAGKVRDFGVRIGGSTYVPFEDGKQLQKRLDRIAEKAAIIKDPFEQSIFLLIHITYLQAFSDVNKRTARLSANISLIKYNLVPLSFSDVDRDDYISAVIAIYELQKVRPMIDLFIFSYMRTCAMYDSTVKSIGFDAIRVRYRQQRRAIIRDIILKKLKGSAMQKFILTSAKLIQGNDRKSFIEDVTEDLHELDQNRIAGLGITPEELAAWKHSFLK